VQGRRVAVAVSGGRDSTALLHCTLRLAQPLGIEVVALHVHHGLMAEADAWLAQVRAQARRWGADFAARRLQTSPAAGDSIEAWARRERYRALAEMARAAGCDLVLLAHHRRDQAETFLLQALRGAGPAGLSAMPAAAQRQGLNWVRPWLDRPRAAIEAYARRHRLRHVDDASNADARLGRSRLRLRVWPALHEAFPEAEVALSAAARHAQEARALAAEVAAQDLPPLLQGAAGAALSVAAWQALPPARRRNALRAWLATALPAPVPETLVDRLSQELPARRGARWPAPGAELHLYRGLLSAAPLGTEAEGADAQVLDLSRPGEHAVRGWSGCFVVEATPRGGVDAARLAAVTASARQGGEQFRLAPRAAARSLKKQYQARGVPVWQRQGPLLFTPQGALLFAPGLGIDAAQQAAPGAPQLALRWLPGAPGRGPQPD
jgi:tRNA(Ile)-lysidine synthase